MSTSKEKELKQACVDVQLLKHKLGELGLYKSMHLMEDVSKAIGWEVAEVLGGSSKGQASKVKSERHLKKVLETIQRPKGKSKQLFGKKDAKK